MVEDVHIPEPEAEVPQAAPPEPPLGDVLGEPHSGVKVHCAGADPESRSSSKEAPPARAKRRGDGATRRGSMESRHAGTTPKNAETRRCSLESGRSYGLWSRATLKSGNIDRSSFKDFPPPLADASGNPRASGISWRSQPRPSDSSLWPSDVARRCIDAGGEEMQVNSTLNSGRGRRQRHSARNRISDALHDAINASFPWFAVHPASGFYAVWSLLGALFLLQDLTMTPMLLAWDIEVRHGPLYVMSWVTPSFWTLDVMICFITAYYRNGRLETRIGEMAKRYLSTWCIPDVIILSCDWAGLILTLVSYDGLEGTDALRVLRIGKTVRMLRIAGLMRLTRVMRVMRYMITIKEWFEEKSENFPVSSQCLVLTLCAVWFNHVIACCWFAVGRLADTDTGSRWPDSLENERRFLQESLTYQYATSLHWSLAQFTLGSADIPCTNSTERAFTVMCLLIGLLFGSTLVSSLSAGMVDYQMRMMEKKSKLRRLSRYLRESKVSQSMTLIVQEQVTARLKIHERLKESDLPVLALLSNTLRMELRTEIVKPLLCTLPLFSALSHLDSLTFQMMCSEAVGFEYPHQQDELFVAGTQTGKAYQVVAGSMLYVQDPGHPAVLEERTTMVFEGTWLSEAAIWTHWTHVGTCKARTTSYVLCLDAQDVVRIVGRSPSISRLCSEYCRAFHSKVVVACPPDEQYASDVRVPKTDWDILVPMIEQDSQIMLSLSVIDQLEGSFLWIGKSNVLDDLRDNIESGESCLIMDAHGQPERLTTAVRVSIENGDGCFLVKLGKAKADSDHHHHHHHHHQPRASCKRPQIKLLAGEALEEGLQRLLARLGFQGEDLQEIAREAFTYHKQMTKYGVRSSCRATEVHFEALRDTKLSQVNRTPSRAATRGSARNSARVVGGIAAGLSGNFGGAADFYLGGHAVDPELLSLPVYKAQDDHTTFFYAWLPPSRIDHFNSPHGKKDLERWVSSIRRHADERGLPFATSQTLSSDSFIE